MNDWLSGVDVVTIVLSTEKRVVLCVGVCVTRSRSIVSPSGFVNGASLFAGVCGYYTALHLMGPML